MYLFVSKIDFGIPSHTVNNIRFMALVVRNPWKCSCSLLVALFWKIICHFR